MAWVTLVTMLALTQYLFFSVKVGLVRQTYGVKAPATTGNEMFERYYRVQQNTMELLVMFVPSTFTFASYVSPAWAAILGVVFIVARALYYRAYVADPKTRGMSTWMTLFPIAVLIIGSIVGAVLRLI
jgi:glutathione S-transferase